MLKLDQRKSGIWRIRGSHYGVRLDQSAKTRSKEEAQQVLTYWEKKIFADVHGLTPAPETKYSLADMVELWLDGGGDPDNFPYLEKIIRALGDVNLKDFTQGFIDRSALKLFPTQGAATRKRHFYTPLSIFLGVAADEGLMPYIKIRRPKVKEKPTYILTPPQIETLIQSDPEFADTITFLVGTGARDAEVFGLDWEHVSAFSSRVTFWDTKTNKARSVDLCPRTKAAMPERSEGQVWRQPSGNAWARNANNNRFYGPSNRLARLSKKLGWRRLGPHTFRHSWASWQYALYKDSLRLMRDGGWSDQKMVERYVHLGSPDLAQQVRDYGWFENIEFGQYLGKKSA